MRLLYVEDERLIRESVAKQIQKMFPLEVFTACHGEEGLELFKKYKPEIVLTDIRMPVCDGLEMTRQIRELSQDTIIVIVTAYADFEYARTALQYQVHDFLIKPITIKSVQETVCELIEMVKVKNMDRDNKLQIQISDMLHGLISSESLFWKKQVILSGCRIQEYQKIGGFTPSDSGLILYAVKNIIEELLEVKQQKIQYCLISESYNMFYLIFYTEYFHSTMQTQQIEYQIKKLCEEMVDVLENNLFLPIAHIETGFFDGRDLYSKYLEVEQCMENDRANQHMIIQMKDAKLEEERIIYALWKDKKFDQVAEKLVLYFNKTNSIQERQNLMIRLSYYLYIAMNEEKGEKQLIFKEFYDSFPKIKREFSEMEIAVRTTETLKKLTEKMEKMEKKILHPVIYNIQKDIRDNYSEVKLLKDYAKKYNINATYLSELFVKECGKTFSDIVTDIKMDKAKNMLNEPDARVYEVAVKLGYHDGRYFSQLFKRCTGMTPKEFQKRCDKYE